MTTASMVAPVDIRVLQSPIIPFYARWKDETELFHMISIGSDHGWTWMEFWVLKGD